MRRLILVLVLTAAAGILAATSLPTSKRWEVETTEPATFDIPLYRGESINLEPQFLQSGSAVCLSNCTNVAMWYRDDSLADGEHYTATGLVLHVNEGRVRIPWTPANEGLSNKYDYTVIAMAPGGNTRRCFGKIKFSGSVGAGVTSSPLAVAVGDTVYCDTITWVNAEWTTPAEVTAIVVALGGAPGATYTNYLSVTAGDILAIAGAARSGSNVLSTGLSPAGTQAWQWAAESWSNSTARHITPAMTNLWASGGGGTNTTYTNYLSVTVGDIMTISGAARSGSNVISTGLSPAGTQAWQWAMASWSNSPSRLISADQVSHWDGSITAVTNGGTSGPTGTVTKSGSGITITFPSGLSQEAVDLAAGWSTNLVQGISGGEWYGWQFGVGDTTNNAGAFVGYYVDALRSGWAWYSSAVTLQDAYANGWMAAPQDARRIGPDGIIALVMGTSPGADTNKVDFEFGAAGMVTNIYDATTPSATDIDKWYAYQITGAQLPDGWTNAVPTYTNYVNGLSLPRRGIPVQATFFASHSNRIAAEVWIDWEYSK